MHTAKEYFTTGKINIGRSIITKVNKAIAIIPVKPLPGANPHQALMILGDRCYIPKTKAVINGQGFTFGKTLSIHGITEQAKQEYYHANDLA